MGVKFEPAIEENREIAVWSGRDPTYRIGTLFRMDSSTWKFWTRGTRCFAADDLESIAAKLRELNGETKGQTE